MLTCLDEGRSPLLLVERTAHAEYFAERLQSFAKNKIVLRGRMKKNRERLYGPKFPLFQMIKNVWLSLPEN
ncbi:hypothetical protein H70357_00980 [Paenibacillus sp. FSL H7-0357]|nr:hypothetical protein H70357_00980 [Paenibacillus sp. FSL H7-0357]